MAAAIAALSMRLKVGVAASVAANVLARPELVTIYKYNFNRSINISLHKAQYYIYLSFFLFMQDHCISAHISGGQPSPYKSIK